MGNWEKRTPASIGVGVPDAGYYETNPDAIQNGPGIPPKLAWSPETDLFEKLTRQGEFLGIRSYIHPKIGETYRYKYHWQNEPWWVDVTLDGRTFHLWKGDGQSFTDTADKDESEAPKEAAEDDDAS